MLAGLVACAALVGCDSGADDAETTQIPIGPPTAAPGAPAPVADTDATPMADRTALLGILNKRNNVTEDIEIKPGEERTIGPVLIRLSACERTAPWELPQEVGAFVQVDIREADNTDPVRVFSGWLFRESPSLNVVEHPIYDVWVKDCRMDFPGEE